ncbi:MAG: hypothetical protein EU981_03405, partial [Candidatus Liberibacter ctenarytainae]|nr:hypothetical protein [Candidatus Liberibacter ctenarytainae]
MKKYSCHSLIDPLPKRVKTHQNNLGKMEKHSLKHNIYRNVGNWPFGGEGLSDTGSKACGPLYLYRLLSQRPDFAIDKIYAQQDSLSPFDGDQPPLHQSTPFHA